MRLPIETEQALLRAASERDVYLEGNLLKVIETSSDAFQLYLDTALTRDREARRKRLEVTKQIQRQNVELLDAQKNNDELLLNLKDALSRAESAKETAEQSLDYMQKRTQFELMSIIVRVSLTVILGVGAVTSILYVFTILIGSQEAQPVGHAWSSIFGILLTNSFSILGTVMGIKYAQGGDASKA